MRLSWLADRIPLLLGVLAESALLSLFADGLAVLRGGVLGFAVPGLALLVVLGVLAGRRLGTLRWRSAVITAGAVLAALAAALLPIGLGGGVSVAGASADGSQGAAIGAGVIGAVAFLRGSAHDNQADDDLAADRLLRWGTWLLLVPWALGMSLGDARRAEFVGPAFAATTLFAATALLGLATSRLRKLASDAGIDWRGGRAWAGVLATLLVGILLFLVPASFVLGAPVLVALAVAATPVIAAAGLIVAGAAAIGGVVLGLLQGLLPHGASMTSSVPAAPPATGQGIPDVAGTAGLPPIVVLAVGAAIAILVIVAIARRRPQGGRTLAPDVVGDERHIDVELHLPRRPSWHVPIRLPRRPGAPGDAEAAYLRLLDDYASDPTLQRHARETPAEHTARLRRSIGPSFSRDLLAADFELARFGGRDLGVRENRRAVDRWRRLRPRRH